MTDWNRGWTERMAPDREPFLITDRTQLTHGDIRLAAGQIGAWLDALGVRPEQPVVGITSDPVEMTRLSLGVVLAGYCFVPLNPFATASELAGILSRLDTGVLVADRAVLDRIDGRHDIPHVEAIVSGNEKSLSDRLLRRRAEPTVVEGFPAVLEAHDPIEPLDAEPSSLALILFTSGSSGVPKGVQLSRRAIVVHLDSLRRAFDHERSVIHNVLPLHHTDGLVQGPLLAYAVGGRLVRPGEFAVGRLPQLLDAVYAHRVTHMITVPTVLSLVNRLGTDFSDAFTSGDFRMVISNAAPLPERLWREVEARFDVIVCNSYGLTETVTSSVLSGPDEARHRRIGTVGRPFDAVVVLLDAEGAEIPEMVAEGEIAIRGEHLFSGYLDNEALTAEVFDGTTFRTGDVGQRDGDGYLRIVGRTSRMIITGGENVAPDQVDAALLQHPAITEAATVGLDDEVWGQRVVAVITVDPTFSTTFDETSALAHCRTVLSGASVPRAVVVVPEIPRTGVGKIDPAAVVAMLSTPDVSAGDTASALRQLAARVFGVRPEHIDLFASPADTEGWDSIAHMELVTVVEERWGIELTNADVIGIASLDDVIGCIERASK